MIVVGIIVLLPTFLMTKYASNYSAAGAIAGFVSLASVLGSLVAHIGTRSVPGRDYRKRWRMLLALSLLGSSLSLFFLFQPFAQSADVGPTSAVIAAGVFSTLLGVCPALIFARLPAMARADSKAGEMASVSANAALAQCGAAGSLAGPPLFGLLISHWGWGVVAPLSLSLATAALVLALFAEYKAFGNTPVISASTK